MVLRRASPPFCLTYWRNDALAAHARCLHTCLKAPCLHTCFKAPCLHTCLKALCLHTCLTLKHQAPACKPPAIHLYSVPVHLHIITMHVMHHLCLVSRTADPRLSYFRPISLSPSPFPPAVAAAATHARHDRPAAAAAMDPSAAAGLC